MRGAYRLLTVLLLLALYRLGRFVLAVQALAHFTGVGWAILAGLLAAVLRLTWLLQAAAFWGAWQLWHWPWPLALIGAMPRAFLMLPGLLLTLKARLRHPRPVWRSAEG